MNFKYVKLFISFGVLVFLIACSSPNDPTENVLDYLSALINNDTASVANLSCAEWEEQAKLEADSFLSVEAELVDVTCDTVTIVGEEADVKCNGEIAMTYDDEIRSIDLSLRTYSLVKDLGEWLLCGYK